MYGIVDFRRLQRETHRCSGLTDAQIEYLKSPAYLEALEEINGKPEAMARLTCGMLEIMSLDPLRGTEVKDFALGLDKADDSIYFLCALHTVSNPVGYFELPREHPEAQALLKAIAANLASKKFKAASTYRRLSGKNSRRYSRFTARARAIRQAILGEYRPAHGHFKAEVFQEYRDRADAAYDADYNPAVDRMQNRVYRVSNAAFAADMNPNWTDILATIAVRYIMPRATA